MAWCTLSGMSQKRPHPSESSDRSKKLKQALDEARNIERQKKSAQKTRGLSKMLPEAPPPGTAFLDMDGVPHAFDSGLKRLAASYLSRRKVFWRYRPFPFPLFTSSGREQELHFDFYIYDNMGTILALIVVVPSESRELWDRLGRFKRQYSMYTYHVWTPQKMAELFQGKRVKL